MEETTEGAPEELRNLVGLTKQVVEDYTMAIAGNRKRTTAARKGLMAIKNLTGEMRKMALEKCNKVKESQ